MREPFISVIIPVYNAEKYLHKCLDSVINQTYNNLEIILIDDGSTDKSSEICDFYARNDSRIVLIHKENGGISSARNTGLSLVSGEYITWVDSDDYLASDYIEYMYNLLTKYDADISSCREIYIYNSIKDRIKQRSDLQHSNNAISTQSLKEIKKARFINNKKDIMTIFVKELPADTITSTFWCKLFKKELFNQIIITGEPFEDANTLYKIIARCNKYVIGEEIKYFHIFSKISASHIFSIKHLNRINARVKQKELIRNNYPDLYDYACANIVYFSNKIIKKLIANDYNSSRFLNDRFENIKVIEFLKKTYRENLFHYLKLFKAPIRNKILAIFAYISIPLTIRIYKAKLHNNFCISKIKRMLKKYART